MKLFNNSKDIIFKFKLKTTNDFNEIEFIIVPKLDKFLEVKNLKYYPLFNILIDKYEPITFKNLNRYKLLAHKDNIDINTKYPFLKYNNNIFSIYDMEIFPVIKMYNTIDLVSAVYSASYKYLNLLLNPYMKNIENKFIIFIKIIGPDEINNDNNLVLYFHEEEFFNMNNNKTLTIFIYFDFNDKEKKYSNVINAKYEYILITNIYNLNKPKIINTVKNADILFVSPISIVNLDACSNDMILAIHEMLIFNLYLNHFKSQSALIVNNVNLHTLTRNQIYYLCYKNVESLTFYKNKISPINPGFYIFENKKNNILTDFTFILNEYIKLDSNFGYDIYIDTEKSWCKKQDLNKNNVNKHSVLIKKIYSNILSAEYINFIKTINKISNKKISQLIKKIQFLNKDYITKNGEINIKKVHNLLEHNILFAIDKLKKYNIEINDIYTIYKKPTGLKIIKDLFPYLPNHLLDKIRLSRDSLYSISDYKGAEKTSTLIKKYFYGINNILDCSANIGGNAMNFAMHFKYIIVNEINTETFNNLTNNISLLQNINTINKNNVVCVNYDINDLMQNKKKLHELKYNSSQFVVFLDPMWSGPLYKMEKVIDLKYGNINIIDFIKNNDIKYACIKVPKNFNFSYLFDNFYNIKIEKYIYCYLIFITK